MIRWCDPPERFTPHSPAAVVMTFLNCGRTGPKNLKKLLRLYRSLV